MSTHAYNFQSPGDVISHVKLNEYSNAAGRVTDVGLYPSQPHDFVVVKIGSNYYARDGNTGDYTYGDDDAVTVITAALGDIPAYGSIYLKGAITLDDTLDLDATFPGMIKLYFDYLYLSGASNDGLVLSHSDSYNMIAHWLICGHTIKLPASYTGDVIKLRNCEGAQVDVRFIYADGTSYSAGSNGVHLIGDGASLGSYWHTVRVKHLRNVETGFRLTSSGANAFANANFFHDSVIRDYVKYGVVMDNSGLNTSGNTFFNVWRSGGTVNTECGFHNEDGDNQYIACRTVDSSGTFIDFENAASATAYLCNCQFANDTVSNSGTIQHMLCHYSSTGKLENAGAAANVADGGTIAHGIDTTPTWAKVSGSVAGEMVSVTGIDATNITVAIKTHAGAAGTAQTIYWTAKKEF